jgi:branched-chain amino acid transport system substrate-binding protein
MKKLALAVTALALLALAACGSSQNAESGSADGPSQSSNFKVLAILALSGPLSVGGIPVLNGINAAVKVLNESGGIDGHKIVLTVEDDQGDATNAVSILVSALNSGDKPQAVFDGSETGETLALEPLLTKNEILSLGSSGDESLADGTKYPYLFHISPVISVEANSLIAYLKSKGYKNVGLFTGDEGYGQSIQALYSQALTKAGITNESVTYSASALDLTAPLEKLESSKPDVILFEGLGPAPARIIQARAQDGISTPFLGELSVTTNVYSQVNAAARQGVSVFALKADVWIPPAQRSKAWNEFLAAAASTPGLGNGNTHYDNIVPWDELQLVELAAKQAGSIDPEAIKQALEHLEQPADKPYLMYGTEAFTPTLHFVTPTPSDFTVIPLSPVTSDGFFKP